MGFCWMSRTEEALSRVQPARTRKYMMILSDQDLPALAAAFKPKELDC